MIDKSNVTILESEKKLNRITVILIAAGAVVSLCLVFVFVQHFKAQRESAAPEILELKQIGATDSSVLLSWNSSADVIEFAVRYQSFDRPEFTEIRTEDPFAAIRGLEPDTSYTAQVIPIDGKGEHEPATLVCRTSPFCKVTSVDVTDIQPDSADVTWKFEGIDEGFTVAAYAIDKEGKRHFISDTVSVAKGAKSRCRLTNLLSEVNYTVCVMPVTRYFSVGKSTFKTDKYSDSYNQLKIIRFVVCAADSPASMQVVPFKTLSPDQPYRTSMIISGDTDSSHKIDMTVYITDTKGRIISEFTRKGLSTNPQDKPAHVYRILLADIKAPSEPGDYRLYAAFNGVTVAKTVFNVE